jgi:CheY-like chemotaxis protein
MRQGAASPHDDASAADAAVAAPSVAVSATVQNGCFAAWLCVDAGLDVACFDARCLTTARRHRRAGVPFGVPRRYNTIDCRTGGAMEVADLTPLGESTSDSPVVLIIDDNPHDVRLLEEAFRERHVAVRCMVAGTAAEAFGLLQLLATSAAPCLIVIDLSLPIASGHRILRTMATHTQWGRIPKVVLSGSERSADRSASFAAGAVEHLVKPATFDGFLVIVDRLQAYLVARMKEKA